MLKYLLSTFFLLLMAGRLCHAQNIVTLVVRDAESREALVGASITIDSTGLGAATDTGGTAIIRNIPGGDHLFHCHYVGYTDWQDTLHLPVHKEGEYFLFRTTVTILLQSEALETEEVIITSTRSTRTFQNTPTRVEFIAGEELEEKGNMKAGDIRMALNESTGIQTQQTSATTANASIRIQGLDGRYTQILKDGFPLFAGFSGGLGLLQTPPLDLRQIEIIKGSASTLYGGGAIAGLVNLVSKVPQKERDLSLVVNGTSAGGLDLNGFYSQRFNKVGLQLFATRNSNSAYDPAGIGLTAIPKFERYVINPKIFIYPDKKTTIMIGAGATTENRIGGDVKYIEGRGDSVHRYFERNRSLRLSSQASLERNFDDNNSLQFKASLNSFRRNIDLPDYAFKGTQWLSYSELSYRHRRSAAEWIGGLNLLTDHFIETPGDSISHRSYEQNTIGAFIQNTWMASKWLTLETGLRGDYVNQYGFAVLPRISALFKISPALTSRLGGGLGYKAPTIFTEETERIQYRRVLSTILTAGELEKSQGLNFDLNYRTYFFDHSVSFSINQLFFYTRIDHPLLLNTSYPQYYFLENIDGHIDTRGLETNLKLGYKDFKFYFGYTLTDAQTYNGSTRTENPLTPMHRINNVLVYEMEEKWKVGLEAYYYSRQQLNDGKTGRPYWLCGLMAERIWKHFSIFVNFENMLDVRQTRFDIIYYGSISNPVFRDIYAPVDGFVVNGGVKVRI